MAAARTVDTGERNRKPRRSVVVTGAAALVVNVVTLIIGIVTVNAVYGPPKEGTWEGLGHAIIVLAGSLCLSPILLWISLLFLRVRRPGSVALLNLVTTIAFLSLTGFRHMLYSMVVINALGAVAWAGIFAEEPATGTR